MSTKIYQKVELFTNFIIILTAILLCYFVVQNFLLSPLSKQAKSAPKIKGSKIEIPNINWEKNDKTLVLYLNSECRYCTESMPFYKNLAEVSKEKNINTIVASNDLLETSKKYLKKHDVNFQEVRQASLDSIGVHGTPTLLLVNKQGEVSNFWVGKLNSSREQEVLDQL